MFRLLLVLASPPRFSFRRIAAGVLATSMMPVALAQQPVATPAVVLSHHSGNLQFAPVVIGSSSGTREMLLEFHQATYLSSIDAVASQGGVTEFSVADLRGCTMNSTIAAGTVCTVEIAFSPKYSGPRNVPLAVVTSAGTYYFGLSGVGTGVPAAAGRAILKTIAGNGATGFAGDMGAATGARLNRPYGLTVDAGGNLYILDQHNFRVREVDASATITTIAGDGVRNFYGDGDLASQAEISKGYAVAVDAAGNFYIADTENQRIRRVDRGTGVISTVAGTGVAGYNGDGMASATAELSNPQGVAVDMAGNLYIADTGNHRIRKVSVASGVITTISGTSAGADTADGVPVVNAELDTPVALAVDSDGNVYFSDSGAVSYVRRIDAATGMVNTVAGTGTQGYSGDGIAATAAQLNNPQGIALDGSGNLYIADAGNFRVRKVDVANGIISTVAGSGVSASNGDGGEAAAGAFVEPVGVAVDSLGNVYVADAGAAAVRGVVPNVVATVTITNGGTKTFNGYPQPVTVTTVPVGLAVTVTYNGSTTVPTYANTYNVVATINDPRYTGSASQQMIIQYAGTQDNDSLNATSFIYGQPAQFHYTLSPDPLGSTYATGYVDFYDATTMIDVDNGAVVTTTGAYLTYYALVGPHEVNAVYGGDQNFSY